MAFPRRRECRAGPRRGGTRRGRRSRWAWRASIIRRRTAARAAEAARRGLPSRRLAVFNAGTPSGGSQAELCTSSRRFEQTRCDAFHNFLRNHPSRQLRAHFRHSCTDLGFLAVVSCSVAAESRPHIGRGYLRFRLVVLTLPVTVVHEALRLFWAVTKRHAETKRSRSWSTRI